MLVIYKWGRIELLEVVFHVFSDSRPFIYPLQVQFTSDLMSEDCAKMFL